MNGWIKLNRKMMEWEWYDDPDTKAVFLHLLLNANFEERRWHGITVGAGQLIISRKKLSEELGISEQKIRTIINRLKSTNEITIKSTNKFSLVTIEKWAFYQCDEEKSTSKSTIKSTNNQPTTNQQLTTTKEIKNNKNNISSPSSNTILVSRDEVVQFVLDNCPDIAATKFYEHCKAKGFLSDNGWKDYAIEQQKKREGKTVGDVYANATRKYSV